jgi:hypothetical protein
MINEAKEILTSFARQIPPTVIGAEKVNYIAEKLKDISAEQKLLLLKYMNHILSIMLERDASDVEVGWSRNKWYNLVKSSWKQKKSRGFTIT